MTAFVSVSVSFPPLTSITVKKSLTKVLCRRAQAGHVCESCSRIFDTARGLMAHRTQIHSLKPKQPVKWTHKDGEGLTRTFVVHAEESNDMTKGALYQCPRDQTHTSHSTRGFKVRVFGSPIDAACRHAVA